MDLRVKYSYEPIADMPDYRDQANRTAIRALADAVTLPDRDWVVLDIATGAGTIIELLWQEMLNKLDQGTVVGIDLANPAIHVTASRVAEASPVLLQGAAQRIPLQAGFVDLVTAGNMIHNLPPDEKQRFLADVYRVLKPGGFFWFNTTFYEGAFSEGTASSFNYGAISAAVRLIQRMTPPVVRKREGRAEARNWLSPDQYMELVSGQGFEIRSGYERTVRCYLESWKAFYGYSEFAAGALHGYPIDVACEVLPQAAEISMEQHGMPDERGERYIPRRWFEVIAVKPR